MGVYSKIMIILFWLVGNLEYFQGKPSIQWYSMNEDESDDTKMVVKVLEVHVHNILAYLVDQLV